MSTPKVSVAMIAYNHERFVAQAVESVLQQQTNFPFEIVFGEDCSPDRTRAILCEIAARQPDRFNLLLPEKNLGMNRNFVATMKACRGDYIALLEGDDYWIDPEKLQLQADYLDAHPECAICFTRANVVDEENQPVNAPAQLKKVLPQYSLRDYLARRFQPRTCTVMFRRGLFPDFPEWYFGLPVGDLSLHVLNAEHGNFGFIDRVTASYRIHAGGVWSLGVRPSEWKTLTPDQQRRNTARIRDLVRIYETVGAHLGPAYAPIIREQVALFANRLTMAYRTLHDWKNMRESAWRQVRTLPLPDSVPLTSLARSLLVSHLPFLARGE